MPRPPRHEYAADLPRGLLTGLYIPASESPASCSRRTRTAYRPRSTRFESARRLRDFTRWFLSYTFSSRLPDPRRLAVPTRPVVVRTASHPPRRPPDQAVLSFNRAAATAQRQGPSTPTRSQWRLVAHEQVIEPAARVGRRPTVKLGLHLRYPCPRPHWDQVTGTAVRRRILRHCSLLPFSIPLPPFPMRTGFPRLGVLRRLRPVPDRSAVDAPSPSRLRWPRGGGQDRHGSRVHCDSLDEGGARLGPCGIATTTPQHFAVASRPGDEAQPRSSPPPDTIRDGCAPLPAHIHQI
jgi:hypothetical protein